jgi:hypothetical protein
VSDGPSQRDVVGSALAGILAGFLVVGCMGGPASFFLERKLTQQGKRGWNLVPIVVWAVDAEPGSVVTFDEISQRSVPEQFVTASIVKPDSASYVVGQAHHPAAKAGDALLWSAFEKAGDAKACLETARAAVAKSGGASAEVDEVLEQLAQRATAPAVAP